MIIEIPIHANMIGQTTLISLIKIIFYLRFNLKNNNAEH